MNPRRRRPFGRAVARRCGAIQLAVAPLLLAACGAGPPPATARPATPPAASAMAQASALPPSSVSSPSPASSLPTSSQSAASNPLPVQLPTALLDAGRARFEGKLGSWTLDGQGSDSPWLPAAALPPVALPTEIVSVSLGGADPIGSWSARMAPASDRTGESAIGLGEQDSAEPPLVAVTLGPLPPGRWVLAVRLDRADGRGDATFYWLVSVE